LRQKYNSAGKKILVSAFGATEMPTDSQDPVVCATNLGNFVINNNLDGADVDYEDNTAMNNGVGEAWLIAFTKQLRSILPGYIITHAPQAPYFCKECYINGGYATVHAQVGNLIDFYNIQFYNQGTDAYNTFTTLFEVSGGPFNATSVTEIKNRGIPLNKIVIGKPVTTGDASNTGWVGASDLNSIFNQGQAKYGWYAGLMVWQFPSDTMGFVSTVTTDLINYCKANPNICV
jgi:chitinase